MSNTIPVPVPPDFYTKTMQRLREFRGQYADGTLDRLLTDAEAAIANLIVLEAATAKESAEARATIQQTRTALNSDRDRWARDVETVTKILGATYMEDIAGVSRRVVKERDEARAALPACEKTIARLEADRNEAYRDLCEVSRLLNTRPGESTIGAAARLSREHHITENERVSLVNTANLCRAERNEARTDVHRLQKQVQEFSDCVYRLRAAFKCVQFEHVETGALRVVNERDAAIVARDAANERANDWRLRYDALLALSSSRSKRTGGRISGRSRRCSSEAR